MVDTSFATYFRERLLNWAAEIERPMPWKGEKDPYLIWLSEIILQQTRVEQGMPYFENFKRDYPTVQALAEAPEDEVMKLWQGLGYYSRARNLHAAAKIVSSTYEGKFPADHRQLLSLPGVGPYTAAAIASFAFALPYAVVDGNVFRILSRVLGIDTPVDTTAGKKEFARIAQELLDQEDPARYNQAIMDFGALKCVPRNPDCERCPLADRCIALRDGLIDLLPVKEKKLVRKDRYFQYFILQWKDQVVIRKRTAKDIWRKLYEFPLIETTGIEFGGWAQSDLWRELGLKEAGELKRTAGPFRQQLTHQRIVAVFREIELAGPPSELPEDYLVVDRKNLAKFAFPKLIDCYLRDNSLNLF
ncbi:A/G-specific adenine glycosylase [Flavilitoribacter nigricans]|uniref:Adenine DNA glycosylase n=1 Tax=Flavilitoribacter nigricans (strain ATCC 23147 / DSM 23189 / NBRC 102662 / NCIMB 1420 / SS-2) TaxID=1122177 RepID=A0A2D0N3X7_FLAN2|nr:A/G-specific adenine glycosylase [Flavilitoribacter nigricans]PHN03076.1 A/G-specific adenine glycosylase [Flavilitoribacter nigricans DSM 23189 = NBRC 102662]